MGGGSSSLTIHRRDITPLCSALDRAVAAATKPLVPPRSTLQTIVMWSEKYYGKMRFSLEALICLSILKPMHWFSDGQTKRYIQIAMGINLLCNAFRSIFMLKTEA